MELIERDSVLAFLQSRFKKAAMGEGHSIFVSGDAGIGKTSLIKAFCKEQTNNCNIYQGACDALFTPRPLAPLYDIAWQVNSEPWPDSNTIQERSALFTRFFQELSNKKENILLVFEDIHWADEATLDFIKFFARRIGQLSCLFVLTYRDDEIHSQHPLVNILGHLPPDSFSRVQLAPLSREAVEKLSVEKGYKGEDVYTVSGGNPFYVNEILASYSPGVPESIKDAILSSYNKAPENTKQVLELLSVIPNSFEIKYLEKFDHLYAEAIENCLDKKILFIKEGDIFFKHELYRRTVENSLSPFKRVALNKKILAVLQQSFEQQQEIERIIHHAKNANDYDTVVKFAPMAAKQAAAIGAHIEASKLYLTAIDYYQGKDADLLVSLYESYAYECYLTNKIKEAIIYTGKSTKIWQEKNDTEKLGNSIRLMSRLWWFDGNRKNAERFGLEAVELFSSLPSSAAKAMAYTNMSQLRMLSDEAAECIFWGEQAMAIAKELNNDEVMIHAKNNVGTVKMKIVSSKKEGAELLQQSLAAALTNNYQEHVARAYTNLSANAVLLQDYDFATKMLDEGIRYCEERDLDSWTNYMSGWKARMKLETGNWKEACSIASHLLQNEMQPAVIKIGALTIMGTISMRSGEPGALTFLLEAKSKALETMELQRIVPVVAALMEYEWLTNESLLDVETIYRIAGKLEDPDYITESSQFAFWFLKVRSLHQQISDIYKEADINGGSFLEAASRWEKSGRPYEQALALFEGDDEHKRKAISIVHALGATAVYEKMKLEMRNSGIKSIPRGIRKSTQANPALLTGRELDVLQLLKEGMQNKEIAAKLFISAKTVDHHISSILFKLDVNSRVKAVSEAVKMEIIK